MMNTTNLQSKLVDIKKAIKAIDVTLIIILLELTLVIFYLSDIAKALEAIALAIQGG